MIFRLCGLLCVIWICGGSSVVLADADYYQALKAADHAILPEQLDAAARSLRTTMLKYPGDYALTLKLASVEFRSEHYAAAERLYREASALSNGSLDARVGLGWALVQQEHCTEAAQVLHGVLAEEPDENADRGLFVCDDRKRLHGTVWGSLSGSLYVDHPWMQSAGALTVAARLRPTYKLQFGGAYRFSQLHATDVRVPSFTQHEIYLEGGSIGRNLDILGQAGLVWGGDAVVGGSRHLGLTLRWKPPSAYLSEVLLDATGSYYHDLWVVSLAPAATLTFRSLSFSGGVSIQRFEHDTLLAGSLTASLTLQSVSFWAGGKLGPEYRAAYLSQFAVFNAQEHSVWTLHGGGRVRVADAWSIFAGYALLRLRSPDGLLSFLHNLSVGSAFTF